jgi:hypothetical protein
VSRRTGRAQLIMLATLGFMHGRAATAADWSQTLDAMTTLAYDTNPQLLPGSSIADQSAQLSVDGNTTAQTEIDQLTITPRFSLVRYARETGLDYQTGQINLAYQETLERGAWTLGGQLLADSTVTSELGLTGITDINRHHYADSATFGYQYLATERLSWQVQGSWNDTRYSDAQQFGLTDYKYEGVQFGPTWSLTDRIDGSLNLETDQISPQGEPTEKDYSASLQIKRKLSEQYSWRVSAGATRVASGNDQYSTSAVFDVGASRQGERVQWDLDLKRAVLPIGLGLLAREDQATLSVAANSSERSTFTLGVSVIRTDPVSIFLYFNPEISFNYLVYGGASWASVTGEWRYNLSPHCALSLAYAQSRARNYNEPEWANGNQARLGIVWQSGRL